MADFVCFLRITIIFSRILLKRRLAPVKQTKQKRYELNSEENQ